MKGAERALLVALPLAALALTWQPGPTVAPFAVAELARADAVGTPARLEREVKLGLSAGADGLGDKRLDEALRAVHHDLEASLGRRDWQAPGVVGGRYGLSPEPMVAVMRDLYLDTHDDALLADATSYRLRHRFRSVGKMLTHEGRPDARRAWPYRCEIQAKIGRKELGAGLSESLESRFELRVESPPFSEQRPPPPPPWHPALFLPVMQSGRFPLGENELATIAPAVALARSLGQRHPREAPPLLTRVVVVTTRWRTHLLLRTPWGSGPNPDQAFIVSLDRSDVFDGPAYLRHLAEGSVGKPRLPWLRGTFLEVEIEFERNVSTRLDRALKQRPDDPQLRRAHAAFLHDQAQLVDAVRDSLEAQGFDVNTRAASKYQQARALIAARQ